MLVDSAQIAKDLGISETYLLPNEGDEFYSADDAAMAFGLIYNLSSCLPDGVEHQAYIYKNENGSFTFSEVTGGVDLGNGFRTVYADEPDYSRLVAWAHTHGPYPDPDNPDYYLDLFTGKNIQPDGSIIGDGSYSYYLNAGGYVFTPGGHFKYLNYTLWTEREVTWIFDSEPAVRMISTNFPTK